MADSAVDDLITEHGGEVEPPAAEGQASPTSAPQAAPAPNVDDLLKQFGGVVDDSAPKQPTWNPNPKDRRADGSLKGTGFLGVLQRPDGKVSSEISVGIEINGKEVEVPTLVPTLTDDERKWLINNDVSDPKKIPRSIIDKAAAFAKTRIAAGKSPFAQDGEGPQNPDVDSLLAQFGGTIEAPAAAPKGPSISAAAPGSATPPVQKSLWDRLLSVGDTESGFAEAAAPAAEYIAKSPVTGAKQVYRGVQEIQPLGLPKIPTKTDQLEQLKKGASDIIEGIGTMATAPSIVAGLANPVAAAKVLVSTYISGRTAQQAAKLVGGNEATQRLAEDVAAGAVALGLTAEEIGRMTGDQIKGVADRGRAVRAEGNIGFENAKPAGQGQAGHILEATVAPAGDIPDVGGTTRVPTGPPEPPPAPAAPAATPMADLAKVLRTVSDKELDSQLTSARDAVDNILERQQQVETMTPGASLPQNRSKLPAADQAAFGQLPTLATRLEVLEAERARRGMSVPAPTAVEAAERSTTEPIATAPASATAPEPAQVDAAIQQFGGQVEPEDLSALPDSRALQVQKTIEEGQRAGVPDNPAAQRLEAERQEAQNAAKTTTVDHDETARKALDSIKDTPWEIESMNDEGKWVAERTAVTDSTRSTGGRTETAPPAKVQAALDILNALPEDVVTKAINAPAPVAAALPTLPRELAGAKPRYNIGQTSYEPKFESDVDKAAYILAQEKPSARDADYLEFVKNATGYDETKARAFGQMVKAHVKALAKQQGEAGELKVPTLLQAAGMKKKDSNTDSENSNSGVPEPVSTQKAPQGAAVGQKTETSEADAERRELLTQIVEERQKHLVALIESKSPAALIEASRTALQQARAKLAAVPAEKKPVTPQIVPTPKAEKEAPTNVVLRHDAGTGRAEVRFHPTTMNETGVPSQDVIDRLEAAGFSKRKATGNDAVNRIGIWAAKINNGNYVSHFNSLMKKASEITGAPVPVPRNGTQSPEQPHAYDRDAAQKTFKQFRTALTKAQNAAKKDGLTPDQKLEKLQAIVAEAKRFNDYYENSAEPWPDYHHDWVRAGEDAEHAIARLAPTKGTVIPGLTQIAISKGAAADEFESGDTVRYQGKYYSVGKPSKEGDSLRLSDGNRNLIVDARKVEYVSKTPEQQGLKTEGFITTGEKKPDVKEEKAPSKKLADYKAGEEVIYTAADGKETRGTVLDPPMTSETEMKRLRVELETATHGAAFDRVYPSREGDVRPAEKKYDYSSTQVNLDGDLKKQILALGRKIPTPDLMPAGLDTEPHVTVKYGLHADGREEITAKFKETHPFDITLGDAGFFPDSGDGDVLYIKIESPELHALNAKVAELPHTDTHPEYQPHLTIAYLKPGRGKVYAAKPLFSSLKGKKFHVGTISTSLSTGKVWSTPLLDKDVRDLLAGRQEGEKPRRTANGGDALERALSPKAQEALAAMFKERNRSKDLRHIREALEVYERLIDMTDVAASTGDAKALWSAMQTFLLDQTRENADEVDAAAYKGLQTITGEDDPDPAELLENEVFASAKEAGNLIFSTLDPKTASFDVEEFNTAFGDVEFRRDQKDVFPTPETRVNDHLKTGKDVIPLENARKIVQGWKDEAKRIGKDEDHSNEVIYSLFDVTGEWSQPWKDAGYTVKRYDIKSGQDLMDFGSWMDDVEEDIAEGREIVGILGAPPCTSFAVSGARWWKSQHDIADTSMVAKKYGLWAADHFDTPLDYANHLVAVMKLIVEQANPRDFYAMENPIGRIAEQNALPKPTLVFDPANFGDPYTKQTQIWGQFNPDLPMANVEPTLGSLMHTLRGDVEEDKAKRSETPEGFAYAFFMANHKAPLAKATETEAPEESRSNGELMTAMEDALDAGDKAEGRRLAETLIDRGLTPAQIKGDDAIPVALSEATEPLPKNVTPNERKVEEEEDEGQANRGGAGAGQLPESRGGAVNSERVGGEGPLGTVPASDDEGTGKPAGRRGPRGTKSDVADRVPRGAGAVSGSEPEHPASGSDVPASVVLPPSGDTHFPGHQAPDYDLSVDRIKEIIGRGPVVRAQDNLDAIKIVKTLAAEERYATLAEQEALAKYVGWGASDMANRLADYPEYNWSANEKRIWTELKEVLTPEERAALRASTPYAHFTYQLFEPMWDALVHAGFSGGRVLEPSIGTGHAFGFMPPDIRKASTLNGIEIEPITAAIAHHLYPSARIQPVGYEHARIARGTQDVIIGNPPFGDWGVKDPRMDDVVTRRIHNYFFGKAIEHARPGGIVMFVATHYAMDSAQEKPLRRYLMDRAEFLGAVRLPSSAFGKSAKTEVITDIIVLRKLREGEKAQNADLFSDSPLNKDLSSTDYRGRPKNIYRSSWYDKHPELVLGTESNKGTMYGGNEYTVEPPEGEFLPKLQEALKSILLPGTYTLPKLVETSTPTTTAMAEGKFKTGELRVGADKKTIVQVDAEGHLLDITPRDKSGKPNKPAVDKIAGMIAIRDARNATIATMRDRTASDADVKKAQAQLNFAYDKFVQPSSEKPNYLNNPTNKRLFDKDPESQNILALEKLDPKATVSVSAKTGKQVLKLRYEVVGKEDIFTKRTVGAEAAIEHVDTPKDALFASIGMLARIDWSYMAKLYAGTVLPSKVKELQQALKDEGLVYEQPDGSYALADEYLSGDVVSKLEDVEAAHEPKRFAKNIEALKEVQPKAKTKDDVMGGLVGITLGSHWVPPDDLASFVAEQLGVQSRGVRYGLKGTQTIVRWDAHYSDDALRAARNHALIVKYANGSRMYDFLDLVNDTLNLTRPKLGHMEGSGKDAVWVKEPQAELAAAANQELLRQAWDQYVLQNEDVLARLLDIFNTRFNRTVERKYDGSHMQYPGMAQLTNSRGDVLHFFPHQNNGVYRILTSGNTLLAHEVGAGKTFEMIAAAMEMRRTGRATKPMITVPTYLLAQWRSDILRLYPNAKLLAFDEKDLAKDKRQQAMARIAHGDWDIVLTPHSSFGLLKVSDERMAQVMQEWIVELETAIEGGEKGSDSVKSMEKQRKKIKEKVENKLKSLEDKKKDTSLTWEQLGVDALMVDEAQAFKNLFFFTKIDNMRGLSRSESDRSLDLYVKIRDINEQSNYRNVVLATATPVMNSIAEIFTMQRYLQPETLRVNGVDNFDNWYAMFAKALPTTERQPDGNYKEVMRLREYNNLAFLAKLVREVMDYVGWEDMPYLKLPKITGGKINIVQVDPHPLNVRNQEWLSERMAALRVTPPHIDREGNYIAPERFDMLSGTPLGKPDNILTVMTDAKKAAIDMRLIVGSRATDYKGSRIQTAADMMADFWKRSKDKKGVALMFLDMGTPKEPPPLTFLAGVQSEDETEGAFDESTDEDEEEASRVDDDDMFNLYDALKKELVQRGVPSHEIAYIHQAKNAAERLALFQAANEGKVRFVFASTDKGGVGMNIQTRLGAMFELDAPRAQRPGDLRQRMGRAIRQGNLYYDWGGVEMYRFVTKGTTDEWLWGLLNTKDYQLRKFYRGEVGSLTEDDPSTMSLEEAQIRATGDPRGVELTELKGKMARLEAQAMAGELAISAARGTIARQTPTKAAVEHDLADLLAWMPKYATLKGDNFSIKIGSTAYEKRDDANKALLSALSALTPKSEAGIRDRVENPGLVRVGDLRGLPIYAQDVSHIGGHLVKSKKGDYIEEVPIFQTRLWMDGSAFGGGTIGAQTVERATATKPESFGEGRNVVAGLVNTYENIPDNEARYKREIKEASDAIDQATRVLANPPTSVAALVKARARVLEIETELKAESAAREVVSTAEARENKGQVERKVRERQQPKTETHEMRSGDADQAITSAGEAVRKAKEAILTTLVHGPSEADLVRHGMRTWRQRLGELAQRHKHATFALRKMVAAVDILAAGADGDPSDPRVQAVRERMLTIADAIEDPDSGARLPENLRPWAEIRNALFALEKEKQDRLGVGLAWRDYYLGHIWQQDGKPGGIKRMMAWMLGGKRPIEGPKSYRKARTIPTTREGVEDFGKEPEDWNWVRLDLAKLQEMRKFTAAATWLLRDLKPSGAARFVSALGKPPEGMRVLPGRFFEVWAPPTVEVREAFDYALMHGLESMLDAMGVPYTRIPDSKKAWGTTEIDKETGEMVVNAKFGGPTDVLMHELGHVLDHRYKLQELFAEPHFQEELAKLASLREADEPRGDDFSAYVQRAPEKIANLIHAYLYVPERLKDVAPQSADRLAEFIESVPELAEAMPDLQSMRSLVLGERTTEKRLPGPVLVGRYYAPAPLAKAAERYLQPGMGAHPAWKLLSWPVNAMVQWTLAYPLFHFFTVTKAAMADEGSQGLQSFAAGHPLRGLQQLAQTPFGPLLAGLSGQKMVDLYRDSPDAMAGSVLDMVQQAFIMGGGRVFRSPEYANHQMQAFMRNVRTAHGAWEAQLPKTAAGAALKAAFHLVPSALEASAWLIMDKYVPMIKTGSALRGIATDLANLKGTPTPETLRAIGTKRVNQADALYGQVIWDNMALHVDRALMNGLQLLIMAPGWRGGALVTALRAFVDPLWRLKKSNREKYTLKAGGAGGGKGKPPSGKGTPAEKEPLGDDGLPPYVHEPWFSSYLALFIMLGVVGAAFAELWQQAHGAGHVESPKDIAAPRDGTKDSDGKDHRDRFPGYEAIFYEMLRHPPFSILQYTLGGESPFPQLLTEWYHNENALGGPIWDPGDTIGDQIAQYARYLKAQHGKPIAVTSYERAQTPDQKRRSLWYASTPASRAIMDTPAEALMRQYAPPRRLTQDDQDKLELKREIRGGSPEEIDAAIASGNLSARDITSAIESGAIGTTVDEVKFTQLPYDKALKVYEAASPEERSVLFPILLNRLGDAIEGAAPNDVQHLADGFNHALELPVGK